MYKKLLITFVASITALIIILSSLLYYNYTSSSIETVKEMKGNILSNISYSSVYMDNIAKKFCQSLMLNNSIMSFAYSKEQDILTISGAMKTLNNLTIPNSYIYSSYIYNNKIDTFLTTNTFYDSHEFFDKEIVEMLKSPQAAKSPSLYPIPRKIPVTNDSNVRDKNVYTYLLFDTNNNKGDFDSAIVLNVDADWLRLTISSLDNKMGKDGNEIFILDDKGDIVSHYSPEMFIQNISDQSYIRDVLQTAAPSGTFFQQLHNKKYVISYVSSDELKWKFISLTPYDTFFSSVKKNGFLTLAFCLIVLVMGLLFAFLASKKLYHPIGTLTKRIKQKLGQDSKPEKNIDEVSFLSTAFNGMIDKTILLENMKRNTAPLLKSDFLKNLVIGQTYLPLEKILAKENELQIDLNLENNLFLFMLKIDFYKDFVDQHNEKDRSLYKIGISNIAKEITNEYYRNEVIETGFDQFTLLVDIGELTEESDSYIDIFHDIVTRIQFCVEKYLNISLTGTLGYVIDSPDQIKYAYEKTLNLSMYRIKLGHYSIITSEMLNDLDDSSFQFPASKEKQLIDSLKLGNSEAAKAAYNDIIKAMEHSSYDTILTSVIYLFFSIYNSLNRIVEGSQSTFNAISIDFFNKVAGFETLEEIERTFFNLFDDIILLKDGTKDKKKNMIVDTVIDMIHANYPDKNLTLTSCAEALSISSVYLGKLFKNATGKSVAEFITTVRMENIKDLLGQTQMPINDILERCGIEKSNYFYTSFKKYFGVSLTEYRLQNVKVHSEKEIL
jgi:two-component system response regulator YesN